MWERLHTVKIEKPPPKLKTTVGKESAGLNKVEQKPTVKVK